MKPKIQRSNVRVLATVLALAILLPQPQLNLAFSTSESPELEILSSEYVTSEHIRLVVRNTGDSSVRIDSIRLIDNYGDTRLELVTAERMEKNPENWEIPENRWIGWIWIYPGEAYVDENPIPPETEVEIIIRPVMPHTVVGDKVHEIIISLEDGTQIEATVEFPVAAGKLMNAYHFFREPGGELRVHYEDGEIIVLEGRDPAYFLLMKLTDKLLEGGLEDEDTISRPERRRLKQSEGIHLITGWNVFLRAIPFDATYPPHVVTIIIPFVPEYRGRILLEQMDCCGSVYRLWTPSDREALREIEDLVRKLRESPEEIVIEEVEPVEVPRPRRGSKIYALRLLGLAPPEERAPEEVAPVALPLEEEKPPVEEGVPIEEVLPPVEEAPAPGGAALLPGLLPTTIAIVVMLVAILGWLVLRAELF